jgi:hypothetical protein
MNKKKSKIKNTNFKEYFEFIKGNKKKKSKLGQIISSPLEKTKREPKEDDKSNCFV